ncbi:response regulator transcription factor [Clostridium sp.]|uniref:response regulator transcription factor n=1 Tax=Clostridium sp. TaxID=1506 RepID=UPI00262D5E11|nr:response regulator transcription factor [Clostridium sp.]
MAKILIIEDEIKILNLLKLELTHEGYEVDTATDGRTGLEKIECNSYEVVILDIMLPQLNGMEVCRRARKFTSVPIIMLTARNQIIDRVTGLDTGADDYITKPFSTEELLARIRSAIRRNSILTAKSNIISYKNITLNLSTCEVKIDEKIIELTKKEYQLLAYMLENRNQVLTREQILTAVWGYDYFGDTNVVDVYIRYLRNKLNDNTNEKYISTVRGTGYVMKEM